MTVSNLDVKSTKTLMLAAIQELQKYDNWTGCKSLENKTPLNPRTNGNAQSNNPATWGSYEQALAAKEKYDWFTVGFACHPETIPIVFVDLDHCVENGVIADWAMEIIMGLNSYSEISPSGAGVHILAKGYLPDNIGALRQTEADIDLVGRAPHLAEMYSQDRWFTVTGNHIPGTPETIENRQPELLALHKRTREARAAYDQRLQAAKRKLNGRAPATNGNGRYTNTGEYEALKDEILAAYDFDTLVSFAQSLFPGGTKPESKNGARILGHGGLIIYPDPSPHWKNYSEKSGGDVFNLAALHLFGNHKVEGSDFHQAVIKAGEFVGIDVEGRLREARKQQRILELESPSKNESKPPTMPAVTQESPTAADSATLESLLETAKNTPVKNRPQALNDLIDALATVDMITVDTYADRIKEMGLMKGKGLFIDEVKARKKAIDQKLQDQVATKDDPLLQAVKTASIEDRPKAIDTLIDALAFADPVTIETYAQQVKALGFRTTKFDEAIAAKRKALRQERLEGESDDSDPWPYEVKQGQIIFNRHGQDGQLESFPVAAFSAKITAEITSEHGGKLYQIQGETHLGQPFSLEIGNDDFASNGKLVAAMTGAAGAKAPVMAKMEPHLRPAIQKLTQGDLQQITRYNRTGWTGEQFLIPGRTSDDVHVCLSPKLPYSLTPGADLQKGLDALESLLAAMPKEQCLPAAVLAFQPALAKWTDWTNERYALFIAGRTGSYKTSWTQVLMTIWGADFMHDHNLIKWGEGATRNAIMALAAGAHDMPLLIDNYKPNTGGGARSFVNLVHNILEGGEKDRLNRNAELRETKPIFCWPVFTGEDVPDTDPASLARVLVVRFAWQQGTPNPNLTKAQELAEHLPAIGNAWLDWLESDSGKQAAKDAKADFAEKRKEWAATLKKSQKDAVNIMRLATNLATNELAYQVMAKHPVFGDMFEALTGAHLLGLEAIACRMAESTMASLEALRFLESLSALHHSGRIEVTPKDDPISNPDRHIGWKDDDGFYLVPDLAIAAVLDLNGRGYLNDISKKSLYSQLDELGYVGNKDERHGKTTINKWIAGKSNRVLHLKPESLEINDSREKS